MNIQLQLALISCLALVKGSFNENFGKEELFGKAYDCYIRLKTDRSSATYRELRYYAEEINKLDKSRDIAMSAQQVITLAGSLVLDECNFLSVVPKISITLREPAGLFYLRGSLIPEILKDRFGNLNLESSFLGNKVVTLSVAFDSICKFLEKISLREEESYSLSDLFEINNTLRIAVETFKRYSVQSLMEEISQKQCFYNEKLNQKLGKDLRRLKKKLQNANLLLGQENRLVESLTGPTNRNGSDEEIPFSRRVLNQCKALAKELIRTGGAILPILLKRETASFRVAFLLCLTNDSNEEVFLGQRIYNLLTSKRCMERVDLFPVVGLAMDKMRKNLIGEKVLVGSVDEVISQLCTEKLANL